MRKCQLSLTDKSQAIHGLTQKTRFLPIKQIDMRVRGSLFPPRRDSGAHTLPFFGLHHLMRLHRQCEGRGRGESIYFSATLAWRGLPVLPRLHQQELLLLPHQQQGQLGHSPCLESHVLATPLCAGGGVRLSGRGLPLSPPNHLGATLKKDPAHRTEKENRERFVVCRHSGAERRRRKC